LEGALHFTQLDWTRRRVSGILVFEVKAAEKSTLLIGVREKRWMSEFLYEMAMVLRVYSLYPISLSRKRIMQLDEQSDNSSVTKMKWFYSISLSLDTNVMMK